MPKEIKTPTEDKFQMIIKAAMNVPGVRIVRSDFLQKELSKKFNSDIVQKAIQNSPAMAGISISEIEDIANGCINFETNKVSSISAVAGIPGGFAMFGTVPADTAQYFGHIIRVIQKLIYLYGWGELFNSNDEFDDETMNQITLFMGIMFGVNGAAAAVTKIASVMASKVEKDLAKKALTKGWLYPIVKKIAEIIGAKMSKEIFAKGVSKIIPIAGGVISGGLTYFSFKPLAFKLKDYLKTLPTADVQASIEHYEDENIIDAEIVD